MWANTHSFLSLRFLFRHVNSACWSPITVPAESSTPRKSSRRPYWMTPDHRPPPGGAADPSRDGFSRRRRSTALHGRDGGGGAPPPPEPAAWRKPMVFSFDGRWRGSRMVKRCRLERPRCVRRRGTTARVLWRRAAAARTGRPPRAATVSLVRTSGPLWGAGRPDSPARPRTQIVFQACSTDAIRPVLVVDPLCSSL